MSFYLDSQSFPGDQAKGIEDYLIAKGEGDNMRKVSSDAYKAALKIAALAAQAELEKAKIKPENGS